MAEQPDYGLRDLGAMAFPLPWCWFASIPNHGNIYRAGFETKERAVAWAVKQNLIQM